MNAAALRMDRMYRWQKYIYDFTRKPYLLGRDKLIGELSPPDGGRVLEIGCGTGRNLVMAARHWPRARFYGSDVSGEMLERAEWNIARAGMGERVTLVQADATETGARPLFGEMAFERIYFSYTLSMIPGWHAALEKAIGQLAPGGALLIADFGDMREWPDLPRRGLAAWLNLFDVEPRTGLEAALRSLAREHGLCCDFVRLYGGYAFLAALRKP